MSRPGLFSRAWDEGGTDYTRTRHLPLDSKVSTAESIGLLTIDIITRGTVRYHFVAGASILILVEAVLVILVHVPNQGSAGPSRCLVTFLWLRSAHTPWGWKIYPGRKDRRNVAGGILVSLAMGDVSWPNKQRYPCDLALGALLTSLS